ncbi:MAG TPA: glycosyltransferase family 4 protein [Chthoniobacterales bacterium]|nr:glycosyltransferase family 4 protein [Chthoniobacterales bacterium]
MRIIIATVQIPFVTGGAESHASGLKAALQEVGHEAEIVTIPFNPAVPERILDQMLACRLMDLTEIHGTKVDRLIALKFPAYLIPHPNKVVWVLHQHRAAYELWDYPFEDLSASPRGLMVREAIRRADQQLNEAQAVFANSRNVASRLRRYCGIEATPLYHPPPNAHAFYTAPATGDYFFFPSRVSASKRQSLVVEALAQTKNKVRVRFAGVPDSPEYGNRLKHLAAKLGVESRIEWLGFLTEEEKRRQYAEAIAVIFPPMDEDYGYVTLEAMLSSKAVITCQDSGGPLEFVLPEKTGIVTKPWADALAPALDRLWEDRSRAAELGRMGRKCYQELGLSWSDVVNRLTR